MGLKDVRLDVEALLSEVLFGHGHLHYGYWDEGPPAVATLQAVGEAQSRYTERLLGAIPEGVQTVLDVGSGTGSNARVLMDHGYRVHCVCPSPRLNRIARRRLPAGTPIFECPLEAFQADARYDLVLFCESFHYTQADRALERVLEHGRGYLLIFDYFRRRDSGDLRRASHGQLLALLGGPFAQGFELLQDEDVSARIAPTLFVLDAIANTSLRPFVLQAVQDFRGAHPLSGRLLGPLLRRLARYGEGESRRHERFLRELEYRLMLLAIR